MTKLFVGQVPAICSEDQLSAIFGQFGEILDISIMRDKATGRSKGSAWVIFEEASAAEDAIDTLHDKHSIPPQSNSLQIRYAGKPNSGGPGGPGIAPPPPQQQQQQQQQQQPPPQQQPQPHIQPLPQQPPPPVQTHDAPASPTGGPPQVMAQQPISPHHYQQQQPPPPPPQQQHRGVPPQHQQVGPPQSRFAYHTDPNSNAPAGMPPGANANAAQFFPQQQQHPQQHPHGGPHDNNIQDEHRKQGGGRVDKKFPPCGGRKLFVGQLPKDMGKEGVEVLMSAYGGIEELHVMMDKKTGLGTGAAFVIFRERKDAQRAIQELNGVHTVGGMKCPMQVRYAEGELDRTHDGKLFVGQVPYAANEEDLKRLFEPFGELTEVALVRRGGQSKGCGFVRYSDRNCAAAAIEALNGRHTMAGGHSPLTVRFADSEEEKRKRRDDRHAVQDMHAHNAAMGGMNMGNMGMNQFNSMGMPGMQMGSQMGGQQGNMGNMGGQSGVPQMMGFGMQMPIGMANMMGRLPMYSPVMSQ